jgi:7,8-dihydro-6-hydroxymethylpterin-pyrophosphokinase
MSGRTGLPIYDLHEATRAIEHQLGRGPREPNGPRRIDIDILAYGALVLDSPFVQVPHPRMLQRTFVLVPLKEIEPQWRHPLTGETACRSLRAIAPGSWTERIGRVPGF